MFIFTSQIDFKLTDEIYTSISHRRSSYSPLSYELLSIVVYTYIHIYIHKVLILQNVKTTYIGYGSTMHFINSADEEFVWTED